jgi:hypothetical protein
MPARQTEMRVALKVANGVEIHLRLPKVSVIRIDFMLHRKGERPNGLDKLVSLMNDFNE